MLQLIDLGVSINKNFVDMYLKCTNPDFKPRKKGIFK